MKVDFSLIGEGLGSFIGAEFTLLYSAENQFDIPIPFELQTQ